MKGIMAFLRGLGFKNIRPGLYAWFFNFFFSLLIYFGYYRVFSQAAGDTKIAANIAGEIGIFTFLGEIANHYGSSLALVFSLTIASAVLYFPVSIFVAGGIFSVLVGDERPSLPNLIASSVENFSPMLKIFLVNLLNWAAALAIPLILLSIFANIEPLTVNETALQLSMYFWFGLTLLALIISTAIYDFSRIFKLKESLNVFSALKKAVIFTFSNKWNLSVIFLAYAVSLVMFFLIYMVFSRFLEKIPYIFFLFLIYQGFVFVRYFLKVAVIRAEVGLTAAGETTVVE